MRKKNGLWLQYLLWFDKHTFPAMSGTDLIKGVVANLFWFFFSVNQGCICTSSNKREWTVQWKVWISDCLEWEDIQCSELHFYISIWSPVEEQMEGLNIPHSVWTCIIPVCACEITDAKWPVWIWRILDVLMVNSCQKSHHF